jgi:hypothetical protein
MKNASMQVTVPKDPTLNHLGKPFAKAVLPGHPLRKFCRSLARRLWRESFGAKIIWRNSRHPGSDCSFRIFTGRCQA